MRLVPLAIVLTGLVASQVAGAVTATCTRPQDRTAFEIADLKSELMVTAISCKANGQYNSFIGRYGSDLTENEKTVNAFFARNFGRRGQKEHDEYITSLANVQSQQSMKLGTGFCAERQGMFDEVMALPAAADIPGYVEGKDIATIDSATLCAGSGTVPERTGRRGARHGGRAASRKRH